jgi:protein-S-isoprenylcysteine O-methyltransferase Ste14
MGILRLFLFSGLVFHKLLWEVMKRGSKHPKTKKHQLDLLKRGIKCLKVIVLLFLAVQTLFLDIFPISYQPSLLRLFGTVIYLVGLTTAVIGRIQLGKNWVDLEDYQVLPGQSVVSNGLYRYLRHPIYTGDLLLLIGLELALNSWLVLGIFVLILIVVRHALEEEALLSNKLPGYSEYCKRTKMFIPFVL